jgi:hypothetical protein
MTGRAWQPAASKAAVTPAHATTKFVKILGQRRFPAAVVMGGRTRACAHRAGGKDSCRAEESNLILAPFLAR